MRMISKLKAFIKRVKRKTSKKGKIRRRRSNVKHLSLSINSDTFRKSVRELSYHFGAHPKEVCIYYVFILLYLYYL